LTTQRVPECIVTQTAVEAVRNKRETEQDMSMAIPSKRIVQRVRDPYIELRPTCACCSLCGIGYVAFEPVRRGDLKVTQRTR
jgi:hypothetical protein